MAKEKNKPPAPVDEIAGAVVFTDAGVRPTNPGYGGCGIHGYTYSTEPPKKGSGNPDWIPTATNYIPKTKEDADKAIKPLHYFNIHLTIPEKINNNSAEAVAMREAMRYATEKGYKKVTFHSDSEVTVGACNGWLEKWAKNNWNKSNGQPVKEPEYWQSLRAAVHAFKSTGAEYEVKWIKAHNGHPGNESADKLATIACFKKIHAPSEDVHHVEEAHPDGYWNLDIERNPLIVQRTMYMSSHVKVNVPGEYYLGSHGKNDDEAGKKMADGYHSFVRLKCPDPAIEVVRKGITDLAGDEIRLVLVRLATLTNKKIYYDLVTHGGHCLTQSNPKRLDLFHLDATPITYERSPPLIGWRALEKTVGLKNILLAFEAGSKDIHSKDITAELFDTTPKGLVLKKNFVSGVIAIRTEVVHGLSEAPLSVALTMGMDTPERNALKRLEGENPLLHVVVWRDGEQAVRYATVIKCDSGSAIYAGVFTNIIITSKN
jgi:ribonuclease HI